MTRKVKNLSKTQNAIKGQETNRETKDLISQESEIGVVNLLNHSPSKQNTNQICSQAKILLSSKIEVL